MGKTLISFLRRWLCAAVLQNTRPDVWEQLLSFVCILKSHTIHGFPSHINNTVILKQALLAAFSLDSYAFTRPALVCLLHIITVVSLGRNVFIISIMDAGSSHHRWINEAALCVEKIMNAQNHSLTNALILPYLIKTLNNSCTVHDSPRLSGDPDRCSLTAADPGSVTMTLNIRLT